MASDPDDPIEPLAELLLALDELTGKLVHDVKQPLAAIVTNANAARRWLAAEPPNLGEASAAVVRIADEGHRASKLLELLRVELAASARSSVG